MSTLPSSLLPTTPHHPSILALTLFTFFFFLAIALSAFSMTAHYPDHDCEDPGPIFLTDETLPLLASQDPLKDYPQGRFVTRTVSAKRAKKQEINRAELRRLLKADWAESSYGTVSVGPRVGEKRKIGEGLEVGMGRGKRVRVEEEEDSDW